MKIVADENIPYLRGVVENFGDVQYLAGADFTHNFIKDADALIVRTVTHFDDALLKNTNVKIICSATIGFDHIDTKYCNENGIKWTNAPGCNSGSVQQYIASSLILLSREYKINLEGKTIGIVGVGNVGKKVAKICSLLGMKVLLNDPPREEAEQNSEFVNLETIKKESDFITFHTPLNKDGRHKTHHLADGLFFNELEKQPFILNSARGAIIDTTSLKEAIKKGQVKGAVIDCWENEPNIDIELFKMVEFGTPHIAGYSADGKSNATRMALVEMTNHFGLENSILSEIKPLSIDNSIIDFNEFPSSSNRIHDAILRTYTPIDDCNRLKTDLTKFKDLRNNYPLRREFMAYTVINAKDSEKTILQELGFNVK